MARKEVATNPLELDLTKVVVTLVQTRVYRNGLQQAEVRIDLESSHGGKPSDLTPREIASIRLFDYHDQKSGDIPFSDDGSRTYRGWFAQHDYRGFVSQPIPPGTPPRALQSYIFYLSANAEATETLDVALAITGDDLSIWRTNGKCTIEGIEQPKPPLDNRLRTITADPPESYPADAYNLDQRPLQQNTIAGVFNRIYAVSIRLADQTTLGIRSLTLNPSGIIHWKDKINWIRQPCYIGYVQTGETEIHWHDAMAGHHGSLPPPTHIPKPELTGVVVMCGRVDIPSWPGAPEESVEMTILDAHGSTQIRHLIFVDGELDELKVT